MLSRARKPKKAKKKARPSARPKAKEKRPAARARRAIRKAPRKAIRRPARKAAKPLRRAVKPVRALRKAKAAKRIAVKKAPAVVKPAAQMAELTAKEVGRVTHFFDNISVAVVELSSALRQGDQIHIKGHSTDIRQRAASMQINHVAVPVAQAGESIGLKVSGRVHEGDRVFRLG